jgi:hypothetical protein
VANRAITLLSDMVSDLNLTDTETGMKAFVREKLMTLKLSANRFTFRTRDNRESSAREMASLPGASVVLGTSV